MRRIAWVYLFQLDALDRVALLMLVLGDERDEAAREGLDIGRHTIHRQFFTFSENERDVEDVTPWRMILWRDMNTEAHLHVALFQRVVMADRIALDSHVVIQGNNGGVFNR